MGDPGETMPCRARSLAVVLVALAAAPPTACGDDDGPSRNRPGDAGREGGALDASMPEDAAAPPVDAAGVDARPDDDARSAPGADGAPPPGPDTGPGACRDPDPAERRLFGVNVDLANPGGSPSAEELAAAGVRWVRVEWKRDPGYALYDPAIARLRASGIRVLLLLDYASVPGKPASDADDGAWVGYLASFVEGVRELGAHYGDAVDAWQLWNEPDLRDPGGPYDPGVPERHFGALLRDGAAALRASSTRPVVTAGLASGDPGYLQRAIDAVGELGVDAISVHPYGQRAPDGWPDPTWGFGEMSDLFDRYLAFGLPLWVSEIGTVDEANQADYLEHVYALAGGEYAGRVQVVLWFCWSDAMVPPFGLYAADGTAKDAYARYRSVAPPWDPACDGVD